MKSTPPTFIYIELLEARIAPATLDVAAGVLTYTASSGVANSLTMTADATEYSFSDSGESITLTPGAIAAGFSGGGTSPATGGENAAISDIHISLGDQDDTLTINGLNDPLAADGEAGADTINVSSTAVAVGGALVLTGEAINLTAAVSDATAVTLTGDTVSIGASIATTDGPITITADNLDIQQAITAGTGTVSFHTHTVGSAINLGTATGGLDLTNAEIDLVTAGLLQIEGGAVNLSSAIAPANVSTLSLIATGLDGPGSIVVSKLRISASLAVSMNSGANDVDVLAVSAHDLSLHDADALIIGMVDGVSGISLDAGSGVLSLTAGATTQGAGADIVCDSLELHGAGSYTLTNTGNNANKLTAGAAGAMSFFDKDDLLVPAQTLTASLTLGAAGTVTQTGVLSGVNGSLTFTGPGVLTLAGSNTYAGDTTLTGGTLNGVGTPGPLFVNGGTLAPGPGADTFLAKNTSFAAGSIFSVQIDGVTPGTQHDVLDVTGTVALGGTLKLTGTFRPPEQTKLVILVNDGVDAATGTFAGLPQDAIVNSDAAHFKINYAGGDGNDVELIALAPSTQDALDALNAKLAQYAGQKTTPPAVPKVPTLITAKADDVVYAVYELAKTAAFDDAVELSVLVKTALEAQADSRGVLKARADKDKIAPRILNAALSGSGLFNDSAAVGAITSALANVNAGTTKSSLTVAGKEALIGQALKSASGSDPAVGQALAELANTLSPAVSGVNVPAETKLRTFSIAAIKAAGTATGEVRSFANQLLTHVNADETIQTGFVKLLAEGVAKVPTAAGGIFGGYADALNDSAKIKNATVSAVLDTKLSKAISAVVAGTASATAVGDEGDFAELVVVGLNTKATTATRASIASGAIQAINATGSTATVGEVITKVLAFLEKKLTKAELSTFAGGAAVGTGDLAPDVVFQIAGLSFDSGGDDVTTLTNVGKAVLKAIATTSGAADAKSVGAAVVDSSTVFGLDVASLTNVAKNLAKAVPTNGQITGGAVAGVGTKLNSSHPNAALLSAFAAAVIPTATKATLNIAEEVAGILPKPVDGGKNYANFAQNIVTTSGFSTVNAPSVAAGVALASLTAAGGHPSPGSGQTAGDIAAAVAQASTALQAKLATIAGSVALAIDIESISGLAAKVASLYQNTGSSSKLPKLTSIGTLATSLAKAINTKPLTGTANRVDELGELAAELTRAAVTDLGPNATDAQLASILGTIGTSVMKGLSAALLINGGAFAADLKDATRDLAGAIAQTISVMGIDGNVISETKVNALLSDTGPLAKAIAKAAKKFADEVAAPGVLTGAFREVRQAMTNSDRLVAGSETLGVGEAALVPSATGKYEVGSLIDPAAQVATP
ncbi:MAG: hypothetical protein QOD99_906 [Chthoniobacter sp.]|nr:hypothetical protein [Chthoniobacter sp.]